MPMCLLPLLALAALLSGPAPGPPGSDSKIAAGNADPLLASRLHRVESAFKEGNSNTLRSSCSSTARVQVDLKGLTAGEGTYGPGQLEVIFHRIFGEFETREFTFGKEDVKVSPPGTAFARGRWLRRQHPGGQETQDTLTFTLREESGDWRILEIRSSH